MAEQEELVSRCELDDVDANLAFVNTDTEAVDHDVASSFGSKSELAAA